MHVRTTLCTFAVCMGLLGLVPLPSAASPDPSLWDNLSRRIYQIRVTTSTYDHSMSVKTGEAPHTRRSAAKDSGLQFQAVIDRVELAEPASSSDAGQHQPTEHRAVSVMADEEVFYMHIQSCRGLTRKAGSHWIAMSPSDDLTEEYQQHGFYFGVAKGVVTRVFHDPDENNQHTVLYASSSALDCCSDTVAYPCHRCVSTARLPRFEGFWQS